MTFSNQLFYHRDFFAQSKVKVLCPFPARASALKLIGYFDLIVAMFLVLTLDQKVGQHPPAVGKAREFGLHGQER